MQSSVPHAILVQTSMTEENGGEWIGTVSLLAIAGTAAFTLAGWRARGPVGSA